MNIYVDDGSGWLTVDNIKGEVRIDDGSGDMTAENTNRPESDSSTDGSGRYRKPGTSTGDVQD